MLDYPYPTNYGILLPGWPVNQTCDRILSGKPDPKHPLSKLAYAIGTFFNASGDHKCYNITSDVPDWGGDGWPYLACTTVYIPFAGRGIFPFNDYNVTAEILSCKNQFGVDLQPDWPRIHWGGFDIASASNIIFSNGMLDPWHTSGILRSLSDSLIAIVIPASAHHLDLWAPNPADPIYVAEARKQEEQIITRWLRDYYKL